MTFVKYMHVERLTEGNTEVDGILNGKVYIYPKLDGSNHCIWYDEDRAEIRCASRNQVLTSEYDSTKFVHTYYLTHKEKIDELMQDFKNLVFYGEFMNPHVIRYYTEDTWYDWFVFDVFNKDTLKWMTYEEYAPILDRYGISYIPPIAILENPITDALNECVMNNHYHTTDDNIGEGIVIKNYEFVNRYGRTTWAKIVRDEFKTASKAKPGTCGRVVITREDTLVDKYLTPDFVAKEYYKFVDERGDWNDRMIPGLIQQVLSEWWKDYSYDVIGTSRDYLDMGNFRRCFYKKTARLVMNMKK